MRRRHRWVGVFHKVKTNRFHARIRVRGKSYHLGSWTSGRLAALAHDRAALFFGVPHTLNYPEESRRLGPARPAELQRIARQRIRKFLGISWGKRDRTWEVGIRVHRKRFRVTGFRSAEEAAVAYDRLARSLGVPRARLNFPERKLRPASGSVLRKEILTRSRKDLSSRYLGVAKESREPTRFRAGVVVRGRKHFVHGFRSEEEAARARDRLALWVLGPKTELNFPNAMLRPASLDELRKERRVARRLRASSRYRGVYHLPHPNARNPWVAEFSARDGKADQHLGQWTTERGAALAVDRATLYYLGEGRVELNLPKHARELGPADATSLRREAWREFKTTTRSRYRGVLPKGDRWVAYIQVRRRKYELGSFDTEERAALAYDRAALKHFGHRARLNLEDGQRSRTGDRK